LTSSLKLIFIIITLSIFGCKPEKFKDVGNIPFNPELDKSEFKICNEDLIKEYYIRGSYDTPPSYKEEKRGIETEILSQYSYPKEPTQNGYVTIRFIVNCKGETGRFRMEEMDMDFKSIQFDSKITDQLLSIVKGLKKWIPRSSGERTYDFYQYLSFKIQNGQIEKIMP